MRLEGFCGPSYESQSQVVAGQQLINMYLEQIEVQDKAQVALYPTPGLKDFVTGLDSPGRGIFHENGRTFFVGGPTFYEITEAGVPTAKGTLIEDANPVTFSTTGDAGNELLITSGDVGSIFNLSTGVFTPTAVLNVTFGGILDGFFVGLDADSSTLRISDSLDGLTWSGIQIIQRTSASDPWKAMIVLNREIFLFGEKSGEVFFNAGNSPIPFARRGASFFERGIAAPFSLARFGNTMAWLGGSAQGTGIVYMMNGYQPVRISNHGVEAAIQTIKDGNGISDALGWSYEKLGHIFYVLTFPNDATWVYDLTMNQWHERGKWNSLTGSFDAYRALFHAPAWDKNLVCDRVAGAIYDLSDTTYTDAGGDVLRRVRRSPHTSIENKRIFFDRFELAAEMGVGLTDDTAQGHDPEVMLRYSDDGGKTWSNERVGKLGKRGEYDARVFWAPCGSARNRLWEVSATDPVPHRWHDAYFEATPGAN